MQNLSLEKTQVFTVHTVIQQGTEYIIPVLGTPTVDTMEAGSFSTLSLSGRKPIQIKIYTRLCMIELSYKKKTYEQQNPKLGQDLEILLNGMSEDDNTDLNRF